MANMYIHKIIQVEWADFKEIMTEILLRFSLAATIKGNNVLPLWEESRL